jgi:acyl carrier protein
VDHVEQSLKDYIAHQFLFDAPEEELANDQPLVSTGIIDSLGIFILVAFLEKEFGVKVQPGDVRVENFETVNALKRLVGERLPPAIQAM